MGHWTQSPIGTRVLLSKMPLRISSCSHVSPRTLMRNGASKPALLIAPCPGMPLLPSGYHVRAGEANRRAGLVNEGADDYGSVTAAPKRSSG